MHKEPNLRDQSTTAQKRPCGATSTNPAPFHSVPIEIISEIFLRCLPVDELPRSSPETAPTSLTHVCRSWRKIAIGTPSLWCRIQVGVEDSDDYPPRHANPRPSFDTRVLECWAGRSRSMPLSIHVGYPAESRLNYDSMLEAVTKLAPQCKDMAFSMPASYLRQVMALVPDSTPLLASLVVYYGRVRTWGGPCHFSLDLSSAPLPLLRSLSIRATFRFNFHTPLNALRTLSLAQCSPSNTLDILRNCPNIEDLALAFYGQLRSDGAPQPESTILLLRVKKFNLINTRYTEDVWEDNDCLEIGELLDHLCLPSLKFFLYRTRSLPYDEKDPQQWDYLSRLLYRSNCSVQDLEFDTNMIDAASVVRCLQLSPGLKHLGVTATALNEELVDVLTRPADDTIATYMCPLLESFHVDYVHKTSTMHTKHVLEIARSRLCLPIGHEARAARFSFIHDHFRSSNPISDLQDTCRFSPRWSLLKDCLDNGLEAYSGIKWMEDREQQGLRFMMHQNSY
ncbi:hypothetical protein BD410DRAFT_901335 [Rickenella mellea]|uniref:Uncharacterized protein n=1 Tax=Rickenella mellea TaxID=50990 RepID=A0A4Y7PT09_9AGAM|nr:hypothetical protein BD410DRAFT_901335 [Rickenella mellea]